MRPIPWPAVFASFLLLQILGFAWYHEAFFGTAWLQDVGIDPNNIPQPPAWVWILMTVATLTKILLLAVILRALRIDSASHRGLWGGLWGGLLGFGLLALTLASHHAFAMAPVRRMLIEGSQEVVGFAIAGALIAAASRRPSDEAA